MMWLANHSTEILLALIVILASLGWAWIIDKQTEFEQEEEGQKFMVDLLSSYDYPNDRFK